MTGLIVRLATSRRWVRFISWLDIRWYATRSPLAAEAAGRDRDDVLGTDANLKE